MVNYHWGLGIEHEYYLFHVKNNKRIVFPSQELLCNLTKDYTHCCNNALDIHKNDIYKQVCCEYHKRYKDDDVSDCWPKGKTLPKLSKNERIFIKGLEAHEYSGRIDCPLISRIKSTMIEIVSRDYKDATVKKVIKELTLKESKLLDIVTKYSKQKIAEYGPIKQHLYGSIIKCKVPRQPSLNKKKYTFWKNKCLDYTGSYHLNITLPSKKQTKLEIFIKQHQEFGRQIQWIEPLIASAFCSPDPRSVGDNNKYTEGSYRVMTTGWGSFAGTDIRKFEYELSGREQTVQAKWRLDKYQQELIQCNKSIGGDIRTISDRWADYTKNEIMAKGEGIEIRIFDHFPIKYIKNLTQIFIILADNSLRNTYSSKKQHVYKDQDWIENIQNIMDDGWNGKITNKYITKLKQNLDIKFNCDSNQAYNVFVCIISALFEKNKNGLCQKLMISGKKVPHIPNINRYAWEFSFNKMAITKKIQDIIKSKKLFTVKDFKKKFYNKFDKKEWKDDFEDMLYALESNTMCILHKKKNKIISIENNL